MIDLRKVEPLCPAHGYRNQENQRLDFSCQEMKSTKKGAYYCTDPSCRLVYNKFCFIGYYKDPNLPFPGVTYPENILDKAMVCTPECGCLQLSGHTGFYACMACGGNFMKHPEYGVTTVPADFFIQDPQVLKFFIQETQARFMRVREYFAKNPDSEATKRYFPRLEQLEKIFVTEILSHCILE